MTASLQVLRGQFGQTSILLSQTSLRLGRDPTQNDVALPSSDQRISRQHLELVEEFGRWILIDHSRNGVHVNGELVKGTRRELEHGDCITIGDSVELLFDDPDSTFTAGQAGPPPTQPPGLRLDPDTLTVWRGDVSLDVEWSPQEFALLHLLYLRRGQLCRYDEIIEAVWGGTDLIYDRGHVHELVARVRRKLEPNPSQPVYLVTRPRHGYVLMAPDSSQ